MITNEITTDLKYIKALRDIPAIDVREGMSMCVELVMVHSEIIFWVIVLTAGVLWSLLWKEDRQWVRTRTDDLLETNDYQEVKFK